MNTREERKHHIATDHGPMVQGRLLTAHPGSVHGDGGDPGGESSLRQGAGTASPGSPDLETAVAVEQRRDWGKGFFFKGFRTRDKYRRKGASKGATRGLGAPWAPGALVGPLRLPLGDSGSFRCADFLYFFP